VHDLLRRLISEGAAHFFADAFTIYHRDPPLRSTTHLVGHLAREVESATRQVLRTFPAAASHIEQNSAAKTGNHLGEIDAILHALGLNAHPGASAWGSFAGEDGWHGTAHRDDLRSPRSLDETFEQRLDLFVDVLGVVLDAAEAKYAEVIERLDPICATPEPDRADLEALAVHLASGVTALSHIFDRLSEQWLIPLRDRGVFRDPPGVRTHEGGSFSFPPWPQARYLTRIAADAPAEVASTILAIPITDNEIVHVAFLEAAARMPPHEAARVARHETTWLGEHRWVSELLPNAVRDLAVRLIGGGEVGAAVELLKAALSLEPETEPTAWHRPRARMSGWSYGELACHAVPALASASRRLALSLVFDLIEQSGAAPRLSRHRIEDGAHPGLDEPQDVLLAHLRDLLLAEAGEGADRLRTLVADLEARANPLYDRLALHLLRVHGNVALDLVVTRASDLLRLSAGDLDDEMTLLVRDRFGDLAPEDQVRVLSALQMTASESKLKEEFGDDISDAERSRIGRHRRLKWFHLLRDKLPANTKTEYLVLLKEFGEPEQMSRRVMFGPNPPLRAVELVNLEDEDLLAYLRNWVPPSTDPFEPSREGLGREIKRCAEQDTSRFSRLARDFRSLSPSYVANLIWGIRERAKTSREEAARSGEAGDTVQLPPTWSIDWNSVLDLLEWTSEQHTMSEDDDAPDNWSWAHRTAVDLAEESLLSALDDDARATRAWNVIRRLMRNADPSPKRDAERADDVDTFAINTVRGAALHAAVRVRRALRDRDHVAFARDIGEEIVRSADVAVEPSLAIRCALAMEFTTIYASDPALARRIASAVFGDGTDPTEDQIVAWRSFIAWNTSCQPVFELLHDAYDAAIDRLGTPGGDDTNARLGDHIIWLAARGAFDLGRSDTPLHRFALAAPTDARHHALNDLGRAIHRTEQAIEPVVVARLCRLWELWRDISEKRDDASDLAAFGWWFTTDHFEPSWALEQLRGVLGATRGRIDWDHEVAAKLITLADAFPHEVAAALTMFIEAPDEWQALRNRKQIRGIVEALLRTAAGDAARETASRLVARGWLDFRDLAGVPPPN